MDLLKRDPGQILSPLDTPESQPIKASDKVGEARFCVGREPPSRHALGLVDHARAVADEDDVAFARRGRDLERVEQGKPFGIAARSLAQASAQMDRTAHHRGDPDRTRIGAAPAVEIDLRQRASDQASTNLPSLRTRRAACSSISAHSPGATPAAGASIGNS